MFFSPGVFAYNPTFGFKQGGVWDDEAVLLPEDVGDGEDTGRRDGALAGALGGDSGARGPEEGAVALHPHVAPAPHQHPVLTAHRLAHRQHCREGRERVLCNRCMC